MVQLINILGDEYVVWDKSAEIIFKRPARENLYADFEYTLEEIESIKKRIAKEKEIEIIRSTTLTDKAKTKVYCEVKKTLYVADKAYYKKKRAERKNHS